MRSINRILLLFLCLTGLIGAAFAQTSAFTYQGRLAESGNPVTGTRLFRFTLIDENGSAIDGAVIDQSLTVASGVFNTNLDFGAANFPGAARSLQISVKINAGDAYSDLSPRQPIAASPYSSRSLSAAQADVSSDSNKLGGIEASEYVTTATVEGTFIRNGENQQSANFNVSGSGIIGGSLGIGGIPQASIKLDVSGNSVFRTANGNVNVGSPNGETGMTIIATNRADVRFNGSTLKLVAGPGVGPAGDTNGIVINTSGNVGIGTATPQAKLHVAGDAVQDRDRGGMAKALLSVNSDGTIARCYNGVTGSTSGDCGFTVAAGSNGSYTVNLGFQVTDRFISVTARSISPIGVPVITTRGANYRFSTLPNGNPQQVSIDTYRTDNGETATSSFMLIVY